MRGDAASMHVIRPASPSEALRAFARCPDALPLAGGTDLLVAWNAGHLNRRTVLDLGGIREWDRIRADSRGLRIGALVTHSRLEEHALVRRRFPLLVCACAVVGGVAIQNRGTLAGNVANASPAGDTFPPLAVYDAVVHAVSPAEKRAIPFPNVFAGAKKTTLRPAELIEAVEIPFLKRPPTRQLFRKVGTRAAQALSKVVAAGLLWTRKDGRIEELRMALGSVAPTVRRLRRVEALVAGERPTPALVDQAAKLVAEEISPIDDVRSTADYRRFVSQALVRDFLGGGG
jgi:CO/xanthine dehydrogenase FAD-binding subunit